MTKNNSFAQQSFEKKLRAADELEHEFHGLMKQYFPLPDFDRVILDKLASKHGRDKLWNLLPLIDRDYEEEDEAADLNDDFPADDQEDTMEGAAPWEDEPPPQDPELAAEEDKFKALCNQAGAYTASVAISICNISGIITRETPQANFLAVLYLAARAQMNANSAITALFPHMNFVNAAVYAKRSNQDLHCIDDAITQLCDLTPSNKMALSPLKMAIDKALEATQTLNREATRMGDNPNLPF